MLVWLPAPTLNLSGGAGAAKQNAVSRFFKSCPDNAFQVRGSSEPLPTLTRQAGSRVSPAVHSAVIRHHSRTSLTRLAAWSMLQHGSECENSVPDPTCVVRLPLPQIKPAGVNSWSVAQRGGAVVRNGAKLLGVGFFASLFGVTITNALVKVLPPVTMQSNLVQCYKKGTCTIGLTLCTSIRLRSSSNILWEVVGHKCSGTGNQVGLFKDAA